MRIPAHIQAVVEKHIDEMMAEIHEGDSDFVVSAAPWGEDIQSVMTEAVLVVMRAQITTNEYHEKNK